MSFESGSVSFRMFEVPSALPADCVARFHADAVPPLDTLGTGDVQGWVGHRHLLDRHITEDNAYLGGYLTLALLKAERKIPNALLRAECKLEEYARMQADGVNFLKRSVRGEIRKSVTDRLLPGMPPTLTAIPFVYASQPRILFAGALSDKQMDALTLAFRRTTGADLIPVLPETAGVRGGHPNVREPRPASFSPEVEDGEAGGTAGQDFLTWLWFFAEARGGMLETEAGPFAVTIEGPLVFVREGGGAHEIVLRKGSPLISAEAKTALLNGKKLRRARLALIRADESWSGTLDADTFVVRGMKLPGDKPLDAVSRFQERMLLLDIFRVALLAYFGQYLEERMDEARWAETRSEIHAWVRARDARG